LFLTLLDLLPALLVDAGLSSLAGFNVGFAKLEADAPHSGVDHSELRWLGASELQSVEWMPADIEAIDQLAARLRGDR
jgi:hypothetical protein